MDGDYKGSGAEDYGVPLGAGHGGSTSLNYQ